MLSPSVISNIKIIEGRKSNIFISHRDSSRRSVSRKASSFTRLPVGTVKSISKRRVPSGGISLGSGDDGKGVKWFACHCTILRWEATRATYLLHTAKGIPSDRKTFFPLSHWLLKYLNHIGCNAGASQFHLAYYWDRSETRARYVPSFLILLLKYKKCVPFKIIKHFLSKRIRE